MKEEFKVDKLGFYRTKKEELALVHYIYSEKINYKDHVLNTKTPLVASLVEGHKGSMVYRQNSDNNPVFEDHYLVEFIAPFDVWEYAKGLEKCK